MTSAAATGRITIRAILVVAMVLVLAHTALAEAPAAPTANVSPSTKIELTGPDVLSLNGKSYSGVRLVAERYKKIEEVVKATSNNGIDEVFMKDLATGRFFVLYNKDGHLEDIGGIKEGFVGNYRGRMVEVVKVDNEANTFAEGGLDVLKGTASVIKKTLVDNFVTALATGTTGIVVAAVLNAGKAAAAGSAVGAAGATGATHAGILAATHAVLVGLVPVLKAAAIAVGIGVGTTALVYGLYSHFRKRKVATIDMIAAESVNDLPGPGMPAPPATLATAAATETSFQPAPPTGAENLTARVPAGIPVHPGTTPSMPVAGLAGDGSEDGPGWGELRRRQTP